MIAQHGRMKSTTYILIIWKFRFFTQLHESRASVNKNMTQKMPINYPGQYGCSQKIDHRRDELLLSCPPADSHNSMKNSWIYFHHPSLSADLQDFQKLSDTDKHSSRKGIVSHGLATCSQQASAVKLYHANSFDSMKGCLDLSFREIYATSSAFPTYFSRGRRKSTVHRCRLPDQILLKEFDESE